MHANGQSERTTIMAAGHRKTAVPVRRQRVSPTRSRQRPTRVLLAVAHASYPQSPPPGEAAAPATLTRATSFKALGLPVGGGMLKSDAFKPQSLAVGSSCLLFALLAWYSAVEGDVASTLMGSVVVVTSVTADYGGNFEPPIFSSSIIDMVCKIDRTAASTYVIWLMTILVYERGAMMLLCIVPLLAALAYSRASTSRSVWIVRHCVWHMFAVLEGLCCLQLTYGANPEHVLRRPTARLALVPAAIGASLLLLG